MVRDLLNFTESSVGIDSKRALAAMAAGSALPILALYLIPFNIAATAGGFEVREGTAGIISSWELGAMAVASLVVAARFQQLNTRLCAALAVLLVVIANLVSLGSMLSENWVLFIASRGLAGIGEGVLLAIANGLGAQTARPDRSFAVFSGFQVVLAGASLLGIGMLMEHFGPSSAFSAAAAISALLGSLILWTPNACRGLASTPANTAAQSDTNIGLSAQDDSVAGRSVEGSAAPFFGRVAFILMGGVVLFNLALSALYPYSERIGANIGLSLATVGIVLSMSAWLAVLGPLACGLTGTRFGRTFPLAVALALQAIGALLLVHTTSLAWWATAQILTAIMLQYCYPFLNGLIAVYDPTGRLNAAAATIMIAVSAVGPLVGGLALNAGGGFVALGWLSAIAYAATFVLLYRPLRAADRLL